MECPHLPELSYREFSARLHEQIALRHIPCAASIEVTSRCNLRCVQCYINESASNREAMAGELSCAEWCHVLDQVADEGCLWLLLTGGEPFLRPDFLDIYTHAKRKGMIVTLFTNGTLVTPAVADHLAEWRPFVVEVTLYGRTRETYEAVTQVPGSFDRCIRGIQLMWERHVPLQLKTVVTRLNRHELGAMRDWATELGLKFRFDPMLMSRIDGCPIGQDVRLAPEDVVELDVADPKRMDAWKDVFQNSGQPLDPDPLFTCGAGRDSFHIDASGRMSVCIMARLPAYDLRRGTFGDGWHRAIPEVLARQRNLPNPCSACGFHSVCGYCPGWGLAECGDLEAVADWVCRVGHLRGSAVAAVA